MYCEVGFPKDRTSHCSFVLGQKYFLVICPFTRVRAKIPGRPGSKSLSKKTPQKQEKDVLKTVPLNFVVNTVVMNIVFTTKFNGRDVKTEKRRSKTRKNVLKTE